MTYPRYLTAPADVRATYHCVSRCVRRAFLCGSDPVTGRRYDHRKRWLEARILELSEVFAVAIHAYAILDNHFHLVIEVDPTAVRKWTDAEVARRWLRISTRPASTLPDHSTQIAAICGQPERLAELRRRLGSLSWFMRCLKEPIARRANVEDDCTGRFWEGRFRSQLLLDEAAVLGAMAYVDLNPVRAGVATAPSDAEYTSARLRVETAPATDTHLVPVATSIPASQIGLSRTRYLELLSWTANALYSPRERATPQAGTLPGALEEIRLEPKAWLAQVDATESKFWRVIGSLEAMLTHVKRLGLRSMRGIGTARRISRSIGRYGARATPAVQAHGTR